MARRMTRRQMLAASAASLGYFHLAPAFSAAKVNGANGKVYFAGIGIKGKGDSDIDNAAECTKIFSGEIVAICDIQDSYLTEKANQDGLEIRNGKPKKFAGTRFFEEGQEVHRLPQAVRRLLATEDHRRGHREHAGPQPCPGKHPGDAGWQACLLPEAAHARCL